MMLNKKLCSFSGLFMAIILGVAPAYAAETTTESMTGTSAVNNVSQSAVSTTVSSQMSQDYINSAINNIKSDSIMTDTSVIDGRTGGYDKNVASSWLEDALSTVKVEGIDTSKYNIVDTSENLNILNAKYMAAKVEMENNNYYTAFKAKANSTENKSTTAQTIFKDTYKDVYESIGKEEKSKSISDVARSYGGSLNTTINSDKSESRTALKVVADKDKSSADYTSAFNKKQSDNQNAFSAKSDDIDTMLNTFKSDLNSNYSDYISSDAYKAVYSSIASTNVTDKIATRQVLPTTISEAALIAQINSLSDYIPISVDTARQKAEASKAATQAGYNSNKSALDASAMQTYTAAVASAKANSGYMDAYKSYLDTSENTASIEQNNVTTTLVFNNQDEFESFVKLAGIDDEDDSYYYYASTDDEISDNRTYIHLDGNSLVLNTQESKMFSDAIKNSGAQVTTVEDTDYLTWKKDEDYDVQENAKENYMNSVYEQAAKKINGGK